MVLKDLGEDAGLESVEHLGIAEETGNVDEHVLIEGLDFGGIGLDVLNVILDLVHFVDDHAALDAAENGGLAIVSEVHAGGLAQELENLVEAAIFGRSELHEFAGTIAPDVGMAGDAGELTSNQLGRKDVVHAAGGDGTARHAVVFGGSVILSEGDAAVGLNFGEPGGAVAAGTREDDADGVMALLLGESAHEVVNGHVKAAGIAAGRELKAVIGDGHRSIGRNDINMIGLDAHAAGDFLDAHGGFLGEQFGEEAVMLGVEMLDEDEGHAGIGGQVGDEFGEGFDAAGGGADSGNQEIVLAFRGRGSKGAGSLF